MEKEIITITRPKFRSGILDNGQSVSVPVDGVLPTKYKNRNWNYKPLLKAMLAKSQTSSATEELAQEWENVFYVANMEILNYETSHKFKNIFQRLLRR